MSEPVRRQTSRGKGRRVTAVVLILIAMAAAVGVWWFMPTSPTLAVPKIDLSDADPPVAAAISAARAGVVKEPTSATAWGHLGMVLQAHDYASPADECFAQAERLDPQDARWPYLRGVGQAATNPKAAIELFERAAALTQGSPWAELRAGELLIDMGRAREAETKLQSVLQSDPQNARAMVGMARLQLLQGQIDAALTWAKRSAEVAPMKRAPHELLAQIHFRRGDHKAAESEQAALKKLPEGAATWKDPFVEAVLALNRGRNMTITHARTLIRRGQTRQGIALLEQLVEQQPSAEQYHELGEALLQAGEVARASELLSRVLTKYPDSPELARLGGTIAFVQGRFDEAAERFRRTIELKPDDAIAHYNLGHCLIKLGDERGALAAFEDAVASKPDFANAHINLARLLIAIERFDEARFHLSAADSLSPEDPAVDELKRQLSSDEPPAP